MLKFKKFTNGGDRYVLVDVTRPQTQEVKSGSFLKDLVKSTPTSELFGLLGDKELLTRNQVELIDCELSVRGF